VTATAVFWRPLHHVLRLPSHGVASRHLLLVAVRGGVVAAALRQQQRQQQPRQPWQK
jgi:hypothetical protein